MVLSIFETFAYMVGRFRLNSWKISSNVLRYGFALEDNPFDSAQIRRLSAAAGWQPKRVASNPRLPVDPKSAARPEDSRIKQLH